MGRSSGKALAVGAPNFIERGKDVIEQQRYRLRLDPKVILRGKMAFKEAPDCLQFNP
jgi:hypothetical protein